MANAETDWIVRKVLKLGVEIELLKKHLGHPSNPVESSLAATWVKDDAFAGGIPESIKGILESV